MRCSNARLLTLPLKERRPHPIPPRTSLKGRAWLVPVPFRRKENDSGEARRSQSLARRSSRAGLCLLQAFASEFLALLAVQSLCVGLLGAFDRGGAARLLGLGGRGRRGLREGGARQQERASESEAEHTGGDGDHGSTYENKKGMQPRAMMMNAP